MFVAPTVGQNSGSLDAFAKEAWRHLYCGDVLPSMFCGKLNKIGQRKVGVILRWTTRQ